MDINLNDLVISKEDAPEEAEVKSNIESLELYCD